VEFTIRFDTFSRLLMTPMGMGRRRSRVRIDDDTVHARMGWAFRATFPPSAVAATERPARAPLSRGVHGWRGSWLVNGAGRPLVDITLQPVQRARVCGFPVRLSHLIVSVDDPGGLVEALRVQ
jgi:hypothetical protein